MMKKTLKIVPRGFTLVELLVVVAIIGLLATLSVLALGSARVRARDAKRLADLKTTQTALELFNNDQGGYPVNAAGIEVGSANARVLTNVAGGWEASPTGSTTYLPSAPLDPLNAGANVYTYISRVSNAEGAATCSTAPCVSYTLQFQLESATQGLPGESPSCARPPGSLTGGAC